MVDTPRKQAPNPSQLIALLSALGPLADRLTPVTIRRKLVCVSIIRYEHVMEFPCTTEICIYSPTTKVSVHKYWQIKHHGVPRRLLVFKLQTPLSSVNARQFWLVMSVRQPDRHHQPGRMHNLFRGANTQRFGDVSRAINKFSIFTDMHETESRQQNWQSTFQVCWAMASTVQATPAIVCHHPLNGLRRWVLEQVQINAPGENEAIVELVATGICHTDLGCGTNPDGTPGFPVPPYPRILGHEGLQYFAICSFFPF